MPAAVGCHVDTELPARVHVYDTGLPERPNRPGRVIVLVVGDDLRSVRLIGPLGVVHRLVVEADRQLTRLSIAPETEGR